METIITEHEREELLDLIQSLGNESISTDEAGQRILEMLLEAEDEELRTVLMEGVAINTPSAQKFGYYTAKDFIFYAKDLLKIK